MPNWNEIVESNVHCVLAAAMRILGNLADAEDVSQEVFAEAFQKWKSSSEQNWTGLLKRISVCRAIDHLRKQKLTESFEFPIADHSAYDPLQIVVERERQQQLRIAVGELPSREAQIFCLIFFEKLKNAEVSKQLGISTGAVAKSLSKAKSKLAEKFNKSRIGENQ